MPRIKKLLRLPGLKKHVKLTPAEGEWFRAQFGKKMDECRELRSLVEGFACELKTGGLSDRLLAKELRRRLSLIPAK